MSTPWYIQLNSVITGPFSSQQLRELAAAGILSEDNLVRKGDGGKFSPAGKVKNLFEAEPVRDRPLPPPPPLPGSALSSVTQPRQLPGWRELPVISLSLVFCFPLGLLLLWTQPRISFYRRTVWTLAVVALFFGMVVMTSLHESRQRDYTAREIASAHQLWTDGNKEEALVVYQFLLENQYRFLADDDRASASGRVIDALAARGEADGISHLLENLLRIAPHVRPGVETELGGIELSKAEASIPWTGDYLVQHHYLQPPGTKQELLGWFKMGDQAVGSAYELRYEDGDTIAKECTNCFTVTSSDIINLPLQPDSVRRCRINSGFVQEKSETEDDLVGWISIIKIGATVGDSWEGPIKGVTFTFVGYKDRELPGETVRCAVIEESQDFPDSPLKMKISREYAIGKGLVFEQVFSKSGQSEYKLVRKLFINGLKAE